MTNLVAAAAGAAFAYWGGNAMGRAAVEVGNIPVGIFLTRWGGACVGGLGLLLALHGRSEFWKGAGTGAFSYGVADSYNTLRAMRVVP